MCLQQKNVSENSIKPFGEVNITTATVTNNLRFPGQYADVESGLNYNYFRDYDPSIGRYIESDPIGLYGGLNTYVYTDNNPIRFIDLQGLKKCSECSPEFSDCMESILDGFKDCEKKAATRCIKAKSPALVFACLRVNTVACGLKTIPGEVKCAAEFAACKTVCDDCP